MAEHTKLGAAAKSNAEQQQQQQQREQQQRNQPSGDWFQRQSMFSGNGDHNPAYDFSGGGERPHQVVQRGVQRYMQERNIGYIEAREMFSQTAEGAAAIRAAEMQNEMLNGGARALMDRMPMPNYQNDRNQPIGAMAFSGGDGNNGNGDGAKNLDELAAFFQAAKSKNPEKKEPGPGEEPMTVGILPTV